MNETERQIVKQCTSCGKEGHHWNECHVISFHDAVHKAFGLTPILGFERGEHKEKPDGR